MNKRYILGFLLIVLIIIPISNIEAVKIPPTRAIERITTSNGTVNAINYSTPIHLVGKGSITITSSDNLKEIYVNSPTGSLSSIQGKNLGSGTGIFAGNFNASMLQFLSLVSSNSQCTISNNSTNAILTCTPGSGGTLTSINSQTGPAINIVGQTGNITITNSTNKIQIGVGSNIATLLQNQTFIGKKIFTNTIGHAGINISPLSGTPTTCSSGDLSFNTGNTLLNVCSASPSNWRPIVTTTQSLTITGTDIMTNLIIADPSIITKQLKFALSGMGNNRVVIIQDNQTLTSQKITIPNMVQNETFAIKPQLTFTSASNQSGTISTIPVMYGGGASLTPKVTGRVELSVSGISSNTLLGDGCRIDIRYGTSSLGSNGGTLAGTLAGQNEKILIALNNGLVPFSKTVQITGLTVNTQEFFDLSFAALTGGTCTLTNVDWSIKEL